MRSTNRPFPERRPPAENRCFFSPRIEEIIREVCASLPNPELAWLFENCLPNTLDTTVSFEHGPEGPDTFIITGDIAAMWLRDSCGQIWPYLPFVREDPALEVLFQGTIQRQVRCILGDPYANAFYSDTRPSPWHEDRTDMKPGVHERKWELDSLAYFLRLSHGFWLHSSRREVFGDAWRAALHGCLRVIEEQMSFDRGAYYRFQRRSHISTETLPSSGRGNPGRPCGLVASGFRPSDDACIFPYLIPSNAMLATCLRDISTMTRELGLAEESRDCAHLATQTQEAIWKWGVGEHAGSRVFYYEVDGYGSRLFMDDANVPSLLALPYLGFVPRDDAVYQNTRALLWSEANPYFFRGEEHAGIGSPHTGPNYIWPMSLVMFALTSDREEEILFALRSLLETHAGTGFMHEAFHRDQPHDFTRRWFGWANSLFGELVLQLYRTRPEILRKV